MTCHGRKHAYHIFCQLKNIEPLTLFNHFNTTIYKMITKSDDLYLKG